MCANFIQKDVTTCHTCNRARQNEESKQDKYIGNCCRLSSNSYMLKEKTTNDRIFNRYFKPMSIYNDLSNMCVLISFKTINITDTLIKPLSIKLIIPLLHRNCLAE